MKTALVFLEDPVVGDMLAAGLRHSGIYPVIAGTLSEAQRLVLQVEPDLVMVDIDTHGAESILAMFQRPDRGNRASQTPTIMVSSDPAAHCGPRGERCGGSLCEPKPFNPRDLVMKAVRLLRRSNARIVDVRWTGTMRRGPIALDLDRFTMTVDTAGGPVPFGLGPTVTRLMARLMDRPGAVCGRDELLGQVWPDDDSVTVRTVDQNIRRIRSALRTVGMAHVIRTVQGQGYAFLPADASEVRTVTSLSSETPDAMPR